MAKKNPAKAERAKEIASLPNSCPALKPRFLPTITEQQIFEVIGPPKSLIKRMLRKPRKGEAWLKVVAKAKRGSEDGCLVDYASFRRAYRRLMAGERPPPLPGKRPFSRPLTSKGGLPTAVGRAVLKLMTTVPHLKEIAFIPCRRSLFVHWADGTKELYSLSRSKDERHRRLRCKNYEARCLNLLDQIWLSDQGHQLYLQTPLSRPQ